MGCSGKSERSAQMTVRSVFEQYKRIQQALSEAQKPELDLRQLLERESARLGVRFVPVNKGDE
jgi:hypothetical protein